MAATMDELPDAVQNLCTAYFHGLRTILPETLYGVYLHGAVVSPSPWPVGDLDFHVILKEQPKAPEAERVQELHADLARRFPPLGAELDAYYILLGDALQASPPPHQLVPGVYDTSWALHRAHMRAGRCIVFFGPDPVEFVRAPLWHELESALWSELCFVEEQLAAYPAYCVLNLCRLVLSFETRNVVISKYEAANWAWETFPEWRHLLEAAGRSYAQTSSAQDAQLLHSEAVSFFGFASARVRETKDSPDG